MLEQLCANRDVPDVDFYLNTFGTPILRKPHKEFERLSPILSDSSSAKFADVPFITEEDWGLTAGRIGDWASKKPTMAPNSSDFGSDNPASGYKYMLHTEKSHLGRELAAASVVLVPKSDINLWYSDQLTPMEHYVPIAADASDLTEKVEWCRTHDDECRRIASNARSFYERRLNREAILDYTHRLLVAIRGNYASVFSRDDVAPNKEPKKQPAVNLPHVETKYPFEVEYLPKPKPVSSKPFVVIIPYRDNAAQDRKTQLELAIPHFKELIAKTPNAKGHIVIGEQSDDGRLFNRGQLLNATFNWVSERYPDAHVVTNDVDMRPSPELFKYYAMRPEYPTHLAGSNQKYTNRDFFGGIVSITPSAMRKINGFPNTIFGWGVEDTMMRMRVFENFRHIWRPPADLKYKETYHTFVAKNAVPKSRERQLLAGHAESWRTDGLSNLRARVIKSELICGDVQKITFRLH